MPECEGVQHSHCPFGEVSVRFSASCKGTKRNKYAANTALWMSE